jgi:hypothetical protein
LNPCEYFKRASARRKTRSTCAPDRDGDIAQRAQPGRNDFGCVVGERLVLAQSLYQPAALHPQLDSDASRCLVSPRKYSPCP